MKRTSLPKPCICFALVLVTAISVALPIAHAQDKDAPYKKVVSIEGITEYRLTSNGLRFLLFPDPAASTVTVNMTVLVGSRHEGYGETGMAHLLEHMLFKGSKGFPEMDKVLQEHGAQSNATTWTDRTNYFETMPATDKNLEFGIKFEADRLLHSFIRREDLAKEMTVVRNEFEQGENEPASILNQRMMAVAFEWHNYGKSTIGNRADIEKVPIDRLHAFYKKYYQVDNIVLVIAGKFDEAKAKQLIVQHFGPLRAPERLLEQTYTEEPAQDGERTVTLRRVGKTAIAALMYHIPSVSHEEHAAVDVLSGVLGNSPSGRLYKALVETKKATTVGADSTGWHDPGILEMTAHVADKVAPEEVRDLMIKIAEGVGQNPVTKEEVERAVSRYLSLREQAMTKSSRIALELSEWIGAGDWRLLFIHRDRVAKVTPEEVNKVAAKYLRASNRTTGLFIPTAQVARTPIPQRPDIDALVKEYKGGKTLAAGEAFDPTPANIEKRVKRLQLAGGIKVALFPKKTRGEAVVGTLTLRFGNEKSLQPKPNAASFLGSLMMRGTKKHDRQEIQDILNNLKSSLNASSSAGSLSVGLQTKRQQLPEVLDLLREVLREPSFPDKEFDILKRGRKQQLEDALTDPETLASQTLSRALNPYPKDDVRYVPTIQEGIERLEKVSLSDVVGIYKDQLGAEHGELVLIGDFDPDAAVKQLEGIFADWKAKVPYERIDRKAAKVAPAKESIQIPDKEGAYYIAGQVFPMTDASPDYIPLVLGNYILGGSSTSRLWERLRQKEGFSYGATSHVSADALDPFAFFMLDASCNPEVIDKVEKYSVEEVARLVKKGVKPSELAEAQKGYLEEMKVRRANDSNLASMLRNGLYLGRTFQYYADQEKKIADLTVEAVNRAVAAHLLPDRLVIIRAGDFSKKAGGAEKK